MNKNERLLLLKCNAAPPVPAASPAAVSWPVPNPAASCRCSAPAASSAAPEPGCKNKKKNLVQKKNLQ